MTLLQRLKLWWLTSAAKSAYADWYRYAYGVGGHYCWKREKRIGDLAWRYELEMNEYRRRLGLVPLWSYSGHWTPADGKTTGLNACSKTPEQYWAEIAHQRRLFDC